MGIRPKGYVGWDGELTSSGRRWLPIFRNGVRSVAKRKHSRLVFSLCAMPFFFFLALVYAIAKPELKMFTRLVSILQTDASLFNFIYTNGFVIFNLVVLSIFCGAGLISGDLRLRALPLYFSRPLSHTGYLAGKLSVILFYLLVFTLAPGILILLFRMIFSGQLIVQPDLLLAVVVFPVLTGLFFASVTLFVSTLSERINFIWIMLVAVFFFSDAVAGILAGATHQKAWFLVSVTRNVRNAGTFFFNQGPDFGVDGLVSVLILALVTALAIGMLYVRVRRAEERS